VDNGDGEDVAGVVVGATCKDDCIVRARFCDFRVRFREGRRRADGAKCKRKRLERLFTAINLFHGRRQELLCRHERSGLDW
jgi:hypothetical protein